jgi:hypothetical protein
MEYSIIGNEQTLLLIVSRVVVSKIYPHMGASRGRRHRHPDIASSHSVCRRREVVAAGDYVRAKTPLRSVLTLTSIAPTPLDVDIRRRRAVVDILGRRAEVIFV